MKKIMCLSILLVLGSCGKYSANSIGGAAGNTSSVASISGYVFTDYSATISIVENLLSIQALSPSEVRYYQPLSLACSGSFQLYYLGETAQAFSGATESDGGFLLPKVPTGKEGLLEFDCDGDTTADQRCLVKAGDDGITCNLISDAVVGALEETLGVADLKQEPALATKSIAKMASAIVEATNLDSTDSQAFKNAIDLCRGGGGNIKECFKGALESSTYSSTFEVVKVLAQTWTVEGLFTFLADTLGFELYVGEFLYSGLGSIIDSALGTNFGTSAKAFIASLITSPDSYRVKISCHVHYFIFGSQTQPGEKFYSPDQTNSNTAPVCNDSSKVATVFGEAPHSNALEFLGSEGGGDSISLTTGTACTTAGEICIFPAEMVIVGKTVEASRNDNQYNFDRRYTRGIDVINAFDEGKDAIIAMDENDPNDCLDINMEGSPSLGTNGAGGTCQTWLITQFGSIKQYFSGIVGLYRYLKEIDNQGSSAATKFSLNDIYKIFAGESFFRGKFVGAGVGKYEKSRYRPVLAKAGSYYQYQQLSTDPNLSGNDLDTVVTGKGKPTFSKTFQEFLQLPTSADLNQGLANKLTHVPWNLFGQRGEWIARISSSAAASPNFPIYCRILKLDPVTNDYIPAETPLIEGSNDVKVDCDENPASSGVTAGSSEGEYNYPSGYEYPYVLTKRGSTTTIGAPVTGVFSIVNRQNLKEIKFGTNPILVTSADSEVCAGNAETAVMIDYYDFRSNNQSSNLAFCYQNDDFFDSSEISNKIAMKKGFVNVTNSTMRNYYDILGFGENPINAEAQLCVFIPRSSVNPASSPVTNDIVYDNSGIVSHHGGLVFTGTTEGAPLELGGSDFFSSNNILEKCDNSRSTDPSFMKFYLVPWDDFQININDLSFKLVSAEQRIILKNLSFSYSKLYNLMATLTSTYPDFEYTRVGEIVTNQGLFANPSFHIKYDPYCDDFYNFGNCACIDSNSGGIKYGAECTFGDNYNGLTFSYLPTDMMTGEIPTIFTAKAGQPLSSLTAPELEQLQSLNLPLADFLTCRYKQHNFGYPKKPTFIDMSNLSSNNHLDCPTSEGGDVTPGVTQGPLRMPRIMKKVNAYLVAKPQTAIKLFNYATKTVGQGITIKRDSKVFTFDEALALITYRLNVPVSGIVVKDHNGVVIPFARVEIDRVDTETSGEEMDPASAILRGMAFPSQMSSVPILEN